MCRPSQAWTAGLVGSSTLWNGASDKAINTAGSGDNLEVLNDDEPFNPEPAEVDQLPARKFKFMSISEIELTYDDGGSA
jgi:hypothetical protein